MKISDRGRGTQSQRGVSSQRLAMLLGVGVAVASAACSGSAAPTSPSVTAPVSLDAHGTGSARVFTASISPTTVAAGTMQSYTVQITNCDTADCSSAEHSSSSQSVKSASVAIPAGWVVDATTLASSISISGSWTVPTVVGNEIRVQKSGNTNLGPGHWVRLTFEATAPCVTSGPWVPNAFNGDVFDTPYALYSGTAPLAVTITGSCEECPAAPAIAGAYLKDDLDIRPPDARFNDIVNEIARRMAAGEFGRDPCAPGYAETVKAAVDGLLAD